MHVAQLYKPMLHVKLQVHYWRIDLLCITPLADYRPENVPTTVTIPAGALRMCFVANDSIVNDDEALEDDETFRLNITTVDPDDPRIRVTEPMTTVIIVDSDGERL